MRQFRLIRKKAGGDPTHLDPESQTYKDLVTASPSIRLAINFVTIDNHAELVGLRMGDTFYSIIVIERSSLQEGHVAL